MFYGVRARRNSRYISWRIDREVGWKIGFGFVEGIFL